jgi:hypothetical protein
MTLVEAAKQALEVLELVTYLTNHDDEIYEAITALRTAIETAEKQEPVAWLYRDAWGTLKLSQIMPPPVGAFPVYTTPPEARLQDAQPLRGATPWEQLYPQFERATPPAAQRPWVGLTADEMEGLYQSATYMDETDHIHMLMLAEAKLKEKNGV